MRKLILSICLLFTTLSLSACDLTYDSFNNDSKKMEALYVEVVEALDNNDVNTLYNLFSKNTQDEVEDLFEKWLLALEYYQGESISSSGYVGLIVTGENYDTKEYRKGNVYTTEVTDYYISIKCYAKHSLGEDYVGITSLHILEHDDTKKVQFTGPLLWIPGVSLGLDGLENENN